MAINKVVYGADTLLDLTEDTVTAEDVLNSKSFHTPDGVKRTGTASYPVTDVQVNGTSVMDGTVAKVEQPTADEQTATDEFTTINGGILSSLKVALSPNQDLHGYSEPWVGGAGKNKAPLRLSTIKSLNTIGTWSDNVYVESGITATFYTLSDTDDSIVKIHAQGTATLPVNILLLTENDVSWLGSLSTVIVNGSPSNAQVNTECLIVNVNSGSSLYIEPSKNISVSGATAFRFRLGVWNGKTVNSDYYPMVRDVSVVDDTFEPYSNICPITGHTQVDVDVSDGDTTQEQVTVNLGGTYYSGTLDVVTGVFTPDTAFVEYDGSVDETWEIYNTNYWRTSRPSVMPSYNVDFITNSFTPKNGAGTRASIYVGTSYINVYYADVITTESDWRAWLLQNKIQICQHLATPTPIQLIPTPAKALVGENHLSAPLDGQEITESKYRQLFTWDEVEEIAQKIADSKIDNLNTSYDTTFSSAFTEARYVKKIYEAPALTALQIVLSGAPSITFNHQLIFSDAQTCCELIQFGSGARIGITDVAISQGSVTFTFDSPLTKAIGFRCRITNDFVS